MSRCRFNGLLQFFALMLGFLLTPGQTRVFTNRWAVKITGGPGAADFIAEKYGFLNMGQIGDLQDHYHFLHPRIMRRSTASSHGNHSLIAMESNVEWVQQQVVHHRTKRDDTTSFNDPKWDKMWYIHCDQNCLTDMNIKSAWSKGYTGKGVVVSILDDGIERIHPDLKHNYDPRASWDFNRDDPDPSPRYDVTDENKHGTRCAGVVAATANNSLCMVGIAYNAKIGGIRMLDGDMSDMLEAQSLSFRPQYIDIYSSSWGPDDDGRTVDGPGSLARLALENGIRKGRKGRGSIFVWASGNGGRNKDHCSCDGYTNSIYTISVSSTTQSGRKPWYLEECASTLATTYSSGESNGIGIVTTDLRQRCTEEHSGTSASAPMAAGIIALTLEANPLLSWRDVQHIIVKTSRRGHLSAPDWQTNGAGHDVSHLYGFGLMDAEAMVTEAERWSPVPPHRVCVDSIVYSNREIRADRILRTTYTSSGCNKHVVYLEHVAVSVTLLHPRRGDLSITLTSPSGTKSQLLTTRENDFSAEGFRRWKFMTTHCWGETTSGEWTLEIRDSPSRRRPYRQSAKLIDWYLVLYGTTVHPSSPPRHAQARSVDTAIDDDITEEYNGPCDPECSEDGCEGPRAHQCVACLHYFLKFKNNTRTCVADCPEGFWGDRKRCKKCYSSCKTCEGSRSNQCTSCKPLHHFNENTSSCVTSCGDGYYVEHVGNVCRKCSENCMRCTSATICTECMEGHSLVGNKCQKSCAMGTYLSEEQGTCEPCHPACASCAGAGVEACKSCAEGYLVEEWKCVSSCSQGFYATQQGFDSKICRRCDASCLSCVGGGRGNCTGCMEGHTLQNGVCVTECKEGEYQDEKGSCHACAATCHKCRGPSGSDCINCSPSLFLDEGQCVAGCPAGRYQAGGQCHLCDHTCAVCVDRGPANCSSCDTDKFGIDRYLFRGQCLDSCPEAHFHTQQKTCEACPEQCQLCTSASRCLKCSPSYYLSQGVCTRLECGEGEVEDPDYDDCMPCEEGCKKCVLYNPKHCMSCIDGYYKFEEGCYKHCPAKTYPLEEEMTCVACDSNCVSCDEHECYWCESDLFLLDGKCVQECPDGFYGNEDLQECEECDEACRTCSGPEDDECESCQEGDELQDGECVPEQDSCPSKTYLNDEGECESCHSSCDSCAGSLKSDCVSCVKGRYLTPDQTCVLRCPVGHFGSRASGQCEVCSAGCAQCVSLQQCQRCQSTRRKQLYLQNGQCVQQCTSGFPLGQVCTSCAEGCLTCERNTTHCLSCREPLVLHKHQCLDACPPEHTLREGECQHCPVGCHRCTGAVLCAECEESHFLHEGRCVAECPDGFYDDAEGRVCGRCHPDCELCNGPGSEECNTCADPDASLQNGACVSPCPEHTYRDAHTLECMACDPSCHSCSGPHATSCTTCAEGLRPDAHGQCTTLTSCPPRHYADQDGECHQCHKYCQQCAGPDRSQCLSCSANHYLLNGSCVDACPVGSFRDQVRQTCEACHPSCLSCVGRHSHECLACKPELFRDGKECVETCHSSRYGDMSTRSCEPCDASCAECLGAGPDSCLSCREGQVYLRRRGQCVHTCPAGHYEDSHHRTCEPCHPSCQTCYGKGAQSCGSCHIGYSLVEGACVSQCMMGEYPVVEKHSGDRCERCHDSCLECRGPGPHNCTLCSGQSILTVEGRCLPCCTREQADGGGGQGDGDGASRQQECCNCTETKGECILSTNFAFRNEPEDDDDDEERGNLALFITTCVLLLLGLGAVVVLVRRSLAKGPRKPDATPGRGYEKLSNSSRYGGGGIGATSFSSESYSAGGGGGGGFQGGSSGGRFREEQLVDLSDRSKGRAEDDDDDEDEDEDIVYMGQDGTVYRKFRYGQLGDDNEDELEYDDESYTFRADPFADNQQAQATAPQMV
ncbi:proprotein convertase subtilisin/kexin type 5 isoform X1 [Alosa sapidissima]|uniref:proprotein convertase subtilisin/kexin type 5 isoform X1 n=1 Tax=Alosa sapidissima TaxID=34773 RepID=UPI001C0A0D0F|nr:proprotein convertase subtilisin/kexin type 5 isoform X1 [Alosa sapidissima]